MQGFFGLQIIALLFALVISYFTYLNYRRREFTVREFLSWELLWIGFAFVTIFPATFNLVSQRFGAIRPLDLFTILGFVVTLSISFYTYSNLDRLRKKMEKAFRDMALEEMKNSKPSNRSRHH
jgi:hypothetical protein